MWTIAVEILDGRLHKCLNTIYFIFVYFSQLIERAGELSLKGEIIFICKKLFDMQRLNRLERAKKLQEIAQQLLVSRDIPRGKLQKWEQKKMICLNGQGETA